MPHCERCEISRQTYLLDGIAAANITSGALVAHEEGSGTSDCEGGNSKETSEHFDDRKWCKGDVVNECGCLAECKNDCDVEIESS